MEQGGWIVTFGDTASICVQSLKYLDDTLSLTELKASITSGFKNDIQKCQHPSVWHSIKIVASKTSAKWGQLFSDIPDALTW